MKRYITYFLILILFSCNNTNDNTISKKPNNKKTKIEKYLVIDEEENPSLKKININIRLEKPISKEELKKIGLKIKKEKNDFNKLWIFYYLPNQEIGKGAWGITHFKPELEIKILGVSNKSSKKISKTIISGKILKTWDDSSSMIPSIYYLIKEHNQLFIKQVFAETGLSKGGVITKKVKRIKKGKQIRYVYDNKFGEYYAIEKNGNLGIYDDEGKIREALKKK